MECIELKGILYKYKITYEYMADRIGISTTSFSNKINQSKFNQDEMNNIVEILRDYDRTIDLNIFLNKKLSVA